MADYAISSANLSAIENGLRAINNNLGTLNNNIEVVDRNVDTVNNNVKVVYDEIGALARDFHNFVQLQVRANALSKAQQRIIQIRQEMEKRFGHYDIVRRTTTGILQADDIGIVKKDTISNATEELMISTPGYWLAPCLVALAAWSNDQPELAERAAGRLSRADRRHGRGCAAGMSALFVRPPHGLPPDRAALSSDLCPDRRSVSPRGRQRRDQRDAGDERRSAAVQRRVFGH